MTNRNVVLIDYENVHPETLDSVMGHNVKVLMFIGHKQTKVPKELAASLQKLGKEADYVLATGGGRNALDFHIAFYAGELAAADPKAHFHIVSRDKGFDPLIEHLRDRKIRAHRVDGLWDLPFLDRPEKPSMDDLVAKVVKNLARRGSHRPRKLKTLKNALQAQFCAAPGTPTADELVKTLTKRDLIEIAGKDVKYHPPITKA